MRPTEKLRLKKEKLLKIIDKYESKGFVDIKLFGSVADNTDDDESDIDLFYSFNFNYNYNY
jgi:predicted nucleotidyltransferase